MSSTPDPLTPSELTRTDDAVRNWRPRHSLAESTSPGIRKRPSLAAQERMRRTSEGSQLRMSGGTIHRLPSTRHSTVSEEDVDIADVGLASGSDISLQTIMPRESVDTQSTLINFAPVAAEYMEKEKEREWRLKKHKPLAPSLKYKLERLKLAHAKHSWSRPILSFLQATGVEHDLHDLHELKRLAKFYFPARSESKVYITDFKADSAHSQERRLSEITQYMSTKPSDVHVRWIHAPLGLGPLQSTVDDLFRHLGRPGRPFKNLGRFEWPYATVEVLNFCDRSHFQNMRDVYRFLHDEAKLTEELNEECWRGFDLGSKTEEARILDDLKWRNTHLGLAEDWETLPDYWTACSSDISRQITEGLSMSDYGPLDGLQPTLWQSDKQALHKHSFFGSAQLVRDPFRCFHRDDGFLITLSPMRGVNYLDRHFKRHLAEPQDAIFDNDVASAISFVRQQFKNSGTQKWHRVSVEWLLVHIITEIGVTPHADRQGANAPTLEGAYEDLIQQFRRRRDEHFNHKNREEPAELIKDMLICKDELRRITIMSKRQKNVFEKLSIDVKRFEAEDLAKGEAPDHENQISALEMTQFALQKAEKYCEAFERLFEDICMLLKAVYDLRSIQQRQIDTTTDTQNRIVVLITILSLIFIPFNTLFTYWGMNLTDIRDSEWSQRDFWHVCASAVLALSISCAVFGLLRLAWRNQESLGRRRKQERRGTEKLVFTGPANDKLDMDFV